MDTRLRLGFMLCVVAYLSGSTVSAQTVRDTSDAQVWSQILAVGPVSENWRAHLELQPRWFGDASELGLVIARAAVGRQVMPRASAWLGYASVARTLGVGTHHEQRLWQQLSLNPPAGRWNVTGRIRFEQRWLNSWADESHRLRMMLRTQRPLGTSAWTLALYNETMVTLDTTTRGPQRGYDRNRAYGGVQRRLSPMFTSEFGYIWENSTITGPGQRNDHVAIGVMNVGLFRRAARARP